MATPPAVVARGGDWTLEWHSRQRFATSCRVIIRGLAEPCASWQMVQGSLRTGACSNTNGPRLSEWHWKQLGCCPLARRILRLMKLPWGLWQPVQDIAPSGNGWRCGFWKLAHTSMWHCRQF